MHVPMDGLHGDAQGLPAASPPYGQPQHLAGGMANGAQAQLEALLAASSQSQQSGHLGGMQHDYGGAAWGGGIGHGRAGISPAPQVRHRSGIACWSPGWAPEVHVASMLVFRQCMTPLSL